MVGAPGLAARIFTEHINRQWETKSLPVPTLTGQETIETMFKILEADIIIFQDPAQGSSG